MLVGILPVAFVFLYVAGVYLLFCGIVRSWRLPPPLHILELASALHVQLRHQAISGVTFHSQSSRYIWRGNFGNNSTKNRKY
jgi:hypothetical protein